MDSSTNRFEVIQNTGNIIGLSFAMVLHFNFICNLNINWLVILLCITLIYTLYFLMDRNKKKILTYFIVLIVVLCIFILVVLNKVNLYDSSNRLVSWFRTYLVTKNNYQISYAFILIIFSIVFFILLFNFINKKTTLQIIASLGLIIWLIYCAINGTQVNKISLGIIFIYILQCIVKLSNTLEAAYGSAHFESNILARSLLYHHKNRRHESRLLNFYMLPLCIVIGIVAVSIPSRSQPIQWKIVKQVIHSVSDKWDDITFRYAIFKGKYSDEFCLNFTGYSDEDIITLGGKVYQSENAILKVSTNTKANGSTYLIGNVRDDYYNNGWRRSHIQYNTDQEPIIDLYQMLYGLYQMNIKPKEKEVLFHPIKLSINYKDIRTKSLFYPIKTFNMESNGDVLSVDSSSPTLLSNKILKKDFTYQVEYFEINYESDTLLNYLRYISKVKTKDTIASDNSNLNYDNSIQINTSKNIQTFNRNDCITYLKNLTNLYSFDETILNKDFENVLEQRSNSIYKYFTKLPDQVPKRVRQLAHQITAKYDNNYDKLRAIEAYLSAYHYTLSPTETKKGEDFVDYFLFEQKEGYCTYFATAMAILGRCIDIPTRYVEGVLIDYKEKEGRDYIVSSKSSHAWVEAYIDGFGWIPFEPTPTKHDDRYVKWDEKVILNNQIPEMAAPEYPSTTSNDENKEILSNQKTQRIKYMLQLSIIIFVTICFIMAGIFIGLLVGKNSKYKHASSEEKVTYLVNNILIYLAMDGWEIQVGETLLDYVNRLGVAYNLEGITLEEIASIYMKLRYANKQMDSTELKRVNQYHNQLKQYIVKNTGRWHRIKYYCRRQKRT